MADQTITPRQDVLRTARKKRGWSQEELAERADCSVRRVRDAEAGRPVSPMMARSLADAVGLAYEVLIRDDTDHSSVIVLLPPRPLLVVGRDKEFAALLDRFQTDLQTSQCSVQAIASVRGWPGVGKTTIAAEFLYRPETSKVFPDGGLWTSLGPSPDVRRLLVQWGRALGDSECASIDDVEELSRRLAGRLLNRRLLLVIDDVWHAAQARPFQVGGPRCGMLVTTRLPRVAEDLTPSPAHRYNLDVLGEDDALELLRRVAYRTVESSPDTCRALVREIEGLPLAVQVAGHLLEAEMQRGLAHQKHGLTVQHLLEDVRAGAKALLAAPAPADMADLASQTTPIVAALLKKSTDFLDEQTRERFAYLGAFAPKPAMFRLQDMAVIWKVSDQEALATARQLIDRGLLETVDDRRFWMHALIVCLADSLCAE